jgi:hypothetical protein
MPMRPERCEISSAPEQVYRRGPLEPVDTHMLTAVASNGRGLRWTAVAIDGGDGDDTTKDALDRITIPQDVLDRIAPTGLPRSAGKVERGERKQTASEASKSA